MGIVSKRWLKRSVKLELSLLRVLQQEVMHGTAPAHIPLATRIGMLFVIWNVCEMLK